MIKVIKSPTAWIPIVMSAVALSIILRHIFFVGTAPQADEGAEAHLWQILMAGQLPVVGFFALKWLSRNRQQAILVLVLQASAGLAAVIPVWLLHW